MVETKRLERAARFGRASRSGLLLAAAFGLSFCSVLLLAVLCGIAPFGDKMLIFCDAKDQYISFLAYFRQILLGEQDAFYALEKTMGGNMAGLLAYYSASPFNLLLPLFPETALPLAFHLLVLLKLSLCGLTLAVFFRYTDALTPWSLLFTLSYTLCGYNISYYWCVMWLDGVLMLPLVALGLERLFRQGKGPWLYLISLAAAILANYYTGYMLCVFSVLYAAYLIWSTGGERPFPWKDAGRFAAASLGAGGCAAFLLVPALLSMRGGKTSSFGELAKQYLDDRVQPIAERFFPQWGNGSPEQLARLERVLLPLTALLALLFLAALIWFIRSRRVSRKVKLPVLLALALLLLPVSRTVWVAQKLLVGASGFYEMADGEPNVYVGLLPLLFLPGLFLLPSVSKREKTGAFLLLAALFLSTRYYLTDLAWHGFTGHINFNYRYSFILSFALLILANRAAARMEELRPVQLAAGPLLVALIGAAGVVLGKPLADNKVYAGAAALGFVCFMALWLLLGPGQKKRPVRYGLFFALAALHLFTLLWPARENVFRFDEVMPTSYGEYTQYLEEVVSTVAEVRQADDGLYRSCLDGGINGPMQFGYNGLSHFSSTEREEVVLFLRRLGLAWEQNYWASGMYGRSRAADCLFGVKYSTQGDWSDSASEVLPGTEIRISPYALPLAFVADGGVVSASLDTDDPFEAFNKVFRALSPETGLDVFLPATVSSPAAVDLVRTPSGDYLPAEGASYGELQCAVEIRSEDPLYLYIRGCEEHRAEIYIDGEYFTSCSQLGEWRLICLGSFPPGETITLALRTDGGGLPGMSGDFRLCYESGAALAAYHDALSAQDAATTAEKDSRLISQVTVSGEGQCLLYTVPVDDGWSVRVDGEKTQAERGLGLLLTVPLSPGTHTVELRYVPPGIGLGMLITGFTGLLALAAFIYGVVLRKTGFGFRRMGRRMFGGKAHTLQR